MRDLAELVLFLKDAYRPEDLVEFVDGIRVQGANALGESGHSDLRLIAERKLQQAGVLIPGGSPDAARASWLVVVADILTTVPPVQASSAKEQPLAFTVPTEAADLVRPSHRIDLLIGEAVRDATRHLVISSRTGTPTDWTPCGPPSRPPKRCVRSPATSSHTRLPATAKCSSSSPTRSRAATSPEYGNTEAPKEA